MSTARAEAPDRSRSAHVEDRRPSWRPIHAFFVTAVTVAGCMFVYKLYAFLQTIKRDELAGFAFDPIVIYALVAVGFLLLLAWAFLTGQFRDVESVKYEMLERFEAQERAESSSADTDTGPEAQESRT